MIRALVAMLALTASATSPAREPDTLDKLLTELAHNGYVSGAVVIRDARGTRFARGYGLTDPFTGRTFTPDTPVDSASLAKPVTAAAVLQLAGEGRLDLDASAANYLPELGHYAITVRHLLSHSAGLALDESAQELAGKSNLDLARAAQGKPLQFKPGTAFSYCNLCTIALAEIVERRSGRSYLETARDRLNCRRESPCDLPSWPIGRAGPLATGSPPRPNSSGSTAGKAKHSTAPLISASRPGSSPTRGAAGGRRRWLGSGRPPLPGQ